MLNNIVSCRSDFFCTEHFQRISEDPTLADPFKWFVKEFIKRFWKRGYHIKRSYTTGFIQQKYGYKPAFLAIDSDKGLCEVERHLNPQLSAWLEGEEDAQDFWLGLHSPERCRWHVLDMDNKRTDGKGKNIVGHYQDGKNVRPVARLTLDHCRKIKSVYDEFPGRIWCVSSASLGLHAWQALSSAPVEMRNANAKRRLARIGLPEVESFPNHERCLRVPFGTDYRVITPEKVLTYWPDQIQFFRYEKRTPPLHNIIIELMKLCDFHLTNWKDCGECLNVKVDVEHEVDSVREELLRIADWLKNGCDDTKPSHSPTVATLPSEEPGELRPQVSLVPLKQSKPTLLDYTEFRDRKWALKLEQYVRDGFDRKGVVGDIVREIATYLLWVELYPTTPDKIFPIIWSWILKKHNGYIGRIKSEDGLKELKKEVRWFISTAFKLNKKDESLPVFEEMRRKQAAGEYKRIIRLPPLMDFSSPYSLAILKSDTLRTDTLALTEAPIPREETRNQAPYSLAILKSDTLSETLSPPIDLPQPVVELVLKHTTVGKTRKGKNGKFPIVTFAELMFNALLGIRGMKSLSQKWFNANGYKNIDTREKYKKALKRAGLLVIGGYSSDEYARRYCLTPLAKSLVAQDAPRIDDHPISRPDSHPDPQIDS